MKTYQFIIELEDDPINPLIHAEIEEIKQHITKAMNAGVLLESTNQMVYLNNAFTLEVKTKE